MTNRNRDLKIIHIAKRELGMDDVSYREFVKKITGKTSSGDLDDAGRKKLIEAFKDHGFKPQVGNTGNVSKNMPSYPYLSKLRALWISAYYLGVTRDRRDQALYSFITRMTKIDHPRFLVEQKDASTAINALREWMSREADVCWDARVGVSIQLENGSWTRPELQKVPRFSVAWCLWLKLHKLGEHKTWAGGKPLPSDMANFAYTVLRNPSGLNYYTDEDWDKLIVRLGKWHLKSLKSGNKGGLKNAV